jgi:hypothetical protein
VLSRQLVLAGRTRPVLGVSFDAPCTGPCANALVARAHGFCCGCRPRTSWIQASVTKSGCSECSVRCHACAGGAGQVLRTWSPAMWLVWRSTATAWNRFVLTASGARLCG